MAADQPTTANQSSPSVQAAQGGPVWGLVALCQWDHWWKTADPLKHERVSSDIRHSEGGGTGLWAILRGPERVPRKKLLSLAFLRHFQAWSAGTWGSPASRRGRAK